MRRSLIGACIAVVAAIGSARAADAPVSCGDVQMGAGIKSCRVDATTANTQSQIVLSFHVVNATAASTERVDLIDSKGRVKQTTGTVAGGSPDLGGALLFEAPMTPGVYTCKLTTTGAPTIVAFNCTIL